MLPGNDRRRIDTVATDSTTAALAAVRSDDADYACVPIENSIEGSVLPTLDSLATGPPLQLFAELTLDVAFSIVVRPGTTAADVQTIAAFPVARRRFGVGWPRICRRHSSYRPTRMRRPPTTSPTAARTPA